METDSFDFLPIPEWTKLIIKPFWRALNYVAGTNLRTTLAATVIVPAIVVLGWGAWQRLQQYEDILGSTLIQETAATPQQFKGLEAFTIASVADGLNEGRSTFLDGLKALIIHPDRTAVKLDRIVGDRRLPPNVVLLWSRMSTAVQDTPGLQLPLQVAPRNSLQSDEVGGFITEVTATNGFLFVPTPILRTRHALTDLTLASNAGKLRKVLEASDAEILHDIDLTAATAPFLKTLLTEPVISPFIDLAPSAQPIQVFVISMHGVTRIWKQTKDLKQYYERQFSPTTYFPSRPYFWPAVANTALHKLKPGSGSQVRIADFFYVTPPYLDLGGNGIVVTLARPLLVHGMTQAVVCMDVSVQPQYQVKTTLTNRVLALGGKAVLVRCPTASGECIPTAGPPGSLSPDDVAAAQLTREVTGFIQLKSRDERSLALGNMQVLDGTVEHQVYTAAVSGARRSDSFNSITSTEMHVSVPLESDLDGSDFLVFSLDLPAYQSRTRWIIAGAVALIMLLIVIVVARFYRARVREADFRNAFEQVDEVMSLDPTPYVRLDEKDHIVASNWPFRALVGYSEEALRLVKFRDLCSPEFAKTYDKVQKQRMRGERVEPYTIEIRRDDQRFEKRRIVSEAVPAAREGALPDTFGILLPDPDA
jgi:PAS domain-containing protein